MLDTVVSLVAVGVLWGATNPLIKKGSAGVETIECSSAKLQWFYEIKFLACRWQYTIPFLLNQSGSILYYFTLSNSDLTLAVPVANSVTFIATTLCGWILGEELPNQNTSIGILLILCGISLCFLDKL